VAVAFVFVGIMMLVTATFIRKIGTRLGS
jgi:hypothetical protein